jgi:hypothetical protein
VLFVIVPLAIVVVAVIALTVLVWRKWPYLKKLEPESHRVGDTFLHDLAPETVDRFRTFSWKALWRRVLLVLDETLSTIRAFFVRIDRASARLMKSVRRTHETVEREQQRDEERRTEPEPEPRVDEERSRQEAEQARLKQREQQLIVDIAQDPKQVERYKELSSVYKRLGAKQDAAEVLRAALKVEPDNEDLKRTLEQLEMTAQE